MAKLTPRQIGEELAEHDKLECELISDDLDRENWEEWQAATDTQYWNPADDWDEPFYNDNDYGYDPYPMPFDDWFDGEF